jgi:phosphatidylglycerol:prolipoprotein diacylglycerol transferase
MYPELITLYGSFAIHTYGLIIALGVIIFSYLVLKDPKRPSIIKKDQCIQLITYAIVATIIGARLLYVINEWHTFESFQELFYIWQGGFSILGGILGALIFISCYVWYHKIPLIPLLDLFAIYAPLLQAMGRIGCFFAGCCAGIATNVPWAISIPCMGADSFRFHPAQLYSAGLLFIIFLIMYFFASKQVRIPGQLISLYLVLVSFERFIIDFVRANRWMSASSFFSNTQLIALGVLLIALLFLSVITLYGRNRK